METLLSETGLSTYMLSVLYDFHGHKFGARSAEETLMAWYIPNPTIPSMYGLAKQDIKAMISRREVSLRQQYEQGLLTHEMKDFMLVYEFLGWAQTRGGHFVYIYFVGRNGKSAQEFAKVENWEIVHKDHLSLFHTRLSNMKDPKKHYYAMNSLDIKETGDGRKHLSLDVRFIVNKWLNSSENEKCKPLLRERLGLFRRGEDYLHTLHNYVGEVGCKTQGSSSSYEGCKSIDMSVEDFIGTFG